MNIHTLTLVASRAADQSERPTVPSFNECYSALKPFFETLERCFEDATREAREYFDQRNRQWDSFLAPHQVRYLVKEHLSSQHFAPEEFELEKLAYSGLSVFYQRFHLKIFKSMGGEVPAPGQSRPRRSFYAQQQSLFAALAKTQEDDSDHSTVNLIVLWDFDAAHRLSNLWLVCPKAGGNSRDSVQCHWNEKLPLLMASVQNVETTEPEGEDLPIARKRVLAVEDGDND